MTTISTRISTLNGPTVELRAGPDPWDGNVNRLVVSLVRTARTVEGPAILTLPKARQLLADVTAAVAHLEQLEADR